VSQWERWPVQPGPRGWFDFRPFFERYRRETRPHVQPLP
jgi:hypothetical protein